MTAIDFPNSPTTGTSFSAGGKTWTYNGSVWVLNPRTASKTAYDIAVEDGFVGTEAAWLESLVGADGADGPPGADGAPGMNGVDGTDGTDGTNGIDGIDGVDGVDGQSVTYAGNYSESTTYNIGDVVTYVVSGSGGNPYPLQPLYVSLTSDNLDNDPTSSPSDWVFLVNNVSQNAIDEKQNVVSGVDSTEIGYLNGVTSAIQTQLDAKQATITGGATTITGTNLTASRALASDGSGKVAVSAVTATELGHLSGVTSALQTQLNSKFNATGGTLNNGVDTVVVMQATNAAAIEMIGPGASFIDFKNSGADDFDARLINSGGLAGLNIQAAPSMTLGATIRNITLSTTTPSGGTDGDVWLQYTP